MLSSINKTFGCCSKIFGCSSKKIFVVTNFVVVTKTFFRACEKLDKKKKKQKKEKRRKKTVNARLVPRTCRC